MSRELLGGPFRHGLTFIATLAFVVSFFGARLFATLFPMTVVTASSSRNYSSPSFLVWACPDLRGWMDGYCLEEREALPALRSSLWIGSWIRGGRDRLATNARQL